MSDGNRVGLTSLCPVPAGISRRGTLFASLAGALLGLLPATALGEPKVVDTPPAKKDNPDIKGALVIVGGGPTPDVVRDRFLELAGGKKAKLVVIPTASALGERTNFQRSFSYWRRQEVASVTMLHTLDPKKANDPEFVKPLTEATGVWLSGGDQSRLASAYHNTAVEKELRRLLAHGGVVGGTSAGASVMSSVMITGGNPQARTGTGFGLLPDVVIDQHFENRKRRDRLLGVLSQHPRCLGLGIDEQTAVVVLRGHVFTVIGKANVVVCMPAVGREEASVTVLKPGQTGDLLLLNRSLLARFQPPTDNKQAAAKERRTSP